MHVNAQISEVKKWVVLFVRESKFMQICTVWNVLMFAGNRNFEDGRFFAISFFAEPQSSKCCYGLQAGRTKTKPPMSWRPFDETSYFLHCILTALELHCFKKLVIFAMRGCKYFDHIYSTFISFFSYRINAGWYSEVLKEICFHLGALPSFNIPTMPL